MQRRDVALVMSMDTSYGRDVLRGIGQFRRENPWFRIRSLTGSPNAQSVLARKGRFDGLVGHLNQPALLTYAAQIARKRVSVSNAIPAPGVPRVVVDDVALGRHAAAHLIERGLPRIAMLTERASHYAALRAEGFLREAKERGVPVEILEGRKDTPLETLIQAGTPVYILRWGDRETAGWLRRLPKPFGLAACTESLGFVAMDILADIGLRVPDDVAMVACGYDPLFTEVTPVALSGIQLPGADIGYAACELLARMMSGAAVAPHTCIQLPPGPLHLHASSDLMHSEDPLVDRTLKLFDQHAFTPFTLKEIAAQLGAARRTVEGRFRKSLGRSPMQEVLRRRLLRAEELLQTTDLPLERIARSCGFTEARFLIRAFRHKHRTTPGAYRKAHRRQELNSRNRPTPLP